MPSRKVIMGLFDVFKREYVVAQKKAPEPKIVSSTIFSMEPAGLYGSVYEDPISPERLKTKLIIGAVAGVLVLVALGAFMVHRNNTGDISSEAVRALSEPVDRGLPTLIELYGNTSAQIAETVGEQSTVYSINDSESDTLNVVRIPEDVSAEQLALYYSNGLGSLKTDELAVLLRGAWWLSTNNEATMVLKLKYADFTSKTNDRAIADAIAQQGFEEQSNSKVIASGIDNNGNNYKYGCYPIGNGAYMYWRVACCDLSEVFDDSGLPKNAYYVVVSISEGELMNAGSIGN